MQAPTIAWSQQTLDLERPEKASARAAASGEPARWSATKKAPSAGAWRINQWGNTGQKAKIAVEGEDAIGEAASLRFNLDGDGRPSANLVYPYPFKRAHRYRAVVELSSATGPATVDVMLRREPAPYDPMAIATVRLGPDWQTVTIEGAWATDDPGAFRVVPSATNVSVRVRSLSIEDLGPLPIGQPQPGPVPTALFGLHVNKLGLHTTWPQMGQGLVRLWNTGTTWKDLAPTPEAFASGNSNGWRRLDTFVNYIKRNDRRTEILYVLGMPPRWASASPDTADCLYGVGTCGAPASIDEWRRYVRAVAERYKGRIRYWELWNEPDNRQHYTGSIAFMVELAKAAREELIAVDPENKLVSPGLTNSTGLSWLQRSLDAGMGPAVDIFGYHWYYGAVPERIAASIYNVRRALETHGQGSKPLWNTEGAPACEGNVSGPCNVKAISPEAQASLPARAALTMWMNGVSAFAYHLWEGMNNSLALVQPDFRTPTEPGKALTRLAQWMAGATLVDCYDVNSQVNVTVWKRGNERFRIVWSTSEADRVAVAIPASWNVSKIEDAGGRVLDRGQDRETVVGVEPVLFH